MAGKINTGICFASLICALVLLLTSCDFRLKSEREVEKYLEKQYGQEFTVLSSEPVTDDYYNDDVWRIMAYTVSPKDDPETQFFVFNTVEGESFGVPGFRNGLQYTSSLGIFGKAFVTFEKAQVMPSGVSVMLTYKEPAWREDQSCLIRIDSFYLSGFDTNTETIEKYILDEVSKYQKRLRQTDP